MKSDKELEHDRYEQRAQSALLQNTELSDDYLDSLSPALRSPYVYYQSRIRGCNKEPGMRVLEIGAGTGVLTGVIVETGAAVMATDISESALKVLHKRLGDHPNLDTRVADMESLPFDDESFDTVTCAGSLSYGDNEIVMNEIYRVLKFGGSFVCVDSLNHNPMYRFNRWLHYLRKQRSRSTLERMPDMKLIKSYADTFGKAETRFFGSVTWAMPVLEAICGADTAGRISDKIDSAFKVTKSSFKFVMVAEKLDSGLDGG